MLFVCVSCAPRPPVRPLVCCAPCATSQQQTRKPAHAPLTTTRRQKIQAKGHTPPHEVRGLISEPTTPCRHAIQRVYAGSLLHVWHLFVIVTFAAGDALLLWPQRKGVLSSRSDQVGGLDQQERQLERNRSFSCAATRAATCVENRRQGQPRSSTARAPATAWSRPNHQLV